MAEAGQRPTGSSIPPQSPPCKVADQQEFTNTHVAISNATNQEFTNKHAAICKVADQQEFTNTYAASDAIHYNIELLTRLFNSYLVVALIVW